MPVPANKIERFSPWFVFQYFVSFWFCDHHEEEEAAGGFTVTVFLMSCDLHFYCLDYCIAKVIEYIMVHNLD